LAFPDFITQSNPLLIAISTRDSYRANLRDVFFNRGRLNGTAFHIPAHTFPVDDTPAAPLLFAVALGLGILKIYPSTTPFGSA